MRQGEGTAVLPVRVNESVPRMAALIPAGVPETVALGELYGAVEIQKA